MNKIEVAKARATKILRDNNIDWGVMVVNARKTLAVTDHKTKMVELSKRFIWLSELEEFDGVMHHEVAHIIAGPYEGHGEKFIRICQELYPNVAYSCMSYPIHIGRYLYTCEFCGVLFSSEKHQSILCGTCLREREDKVYLSVTNNRIEVKNWHPYPSPR